jgi:hypothetical protein
MNDLKDPVNDVDDTISDRKVCLLDHRLGHVVLADDGDLVAGGLGEELGPADGSEAAVGEGGLEVGAGNQVLVEIAGLMENLSDGPYTLFAPSNEALGKLSVKEMSKKDATQLVYKHLVPGTYFQPALSNGRLTAVSGSKLFTKATGNKIAIVCQDDMAEAMIQEANLPVTNGVIHIIDRVL